MNLTSRIRRTAPRIKQRRADPVDGQHGKRGKAQQEQDASGDAGQNQAGRGELDVDAERSEDQQDEADVGIGDGADDAFARGGPILDDLGAGGVEDFHAAIKTPDLAAVERGEKLMFVGRNRCRSDGRREILFR